MCLSFSLLFPSSFLSWHNLKADGNTAAYTTVCNTTFNGFTSANHTIYLEPSYKAMSPFKPVQISSAGLNGHCEADIAE